MKNEKSLAPQLQPRDGKSLTSKPPHPPEGALTRLFNLRSMVCLKTRSVAYAKFVSSFFILHKGMENYAKS
jgi:hypothetical protein